MHRVVLIGFVCLVAACRTEQPVDDTAMPDAVSRPVPSVAPVPPGRASRHAEQNDLFESSGLCFERGCRRVSDSDTSSRGSGTRYELPDLPGTTVTLHTTGAGVEAVAEFPSLYERLTTTNPESAGLAAFNNVNAIADELTTHFAGEQCPAVNRLLSGFWFAPIVDEEAPFVRCGQWRVQVGTKERRPMVILRKAW